MGLFQFLQAIFQSFYSKKLYQNVALKWKGRGFIYIFLLMILAMSAVGFTWYRLIKTLDASFYATAAYNAIIGSSRAPEVDKINRVFMVLSDLPDLKLKDGELDLGSKRSQVIYDPLSPDKPLVTINGDTVPDAALPAAPLMITRDGVFYTPQKAESGLSIRYEELDLTDDGWNSFFSIINAMPAFQIKDGVATMPESSPYTVYSMLEEPVLYFDSNTDYSDTLKLSDDLYVAFLKHEAVLWPEGHDNEPKIIRYDTLSKEEVVSVFEMLVKRASVLLLWSGILGLMLVSLLLFGVTIAITSLLAVVTLTLAKYKHLYQLAYDDCQRLTAVAFTPALVLKGILPEFPLNNTLFFIMALGYIYFAINANKDYGGSHD